eukprot:gnl/TRDRNA2_/TRDRNA2_83474_c0_seq1.p1 gnl/TRDRNA2_/TRDRNA2_83474_c0~~gnl/TRDRNA2_/TRDRNA2_83474_c0_seq1.p1  ORF type:complete len:251 (-),score=51.79 gnl/TRDRNA2_/TRDRNA2_83474_c0_seq1:92-844(-)
MSIEVEVRGLAGVICTVTAGSSWTISKLKKAVERVASIPKHAQHLLIDHREPCDKETLRELTDSGAISLSMIRRPRAKAEPLKWLERLAKNKCNFSDFPEHLRADRPTVLEAVRLRGAALKHATDTLKADRDVVLSAVRQDANALQFAAEELRGDAEVALAAAERDVRSLRFASMALRRDREFFKAAVQIGTKVLKFAADELLYDHDFALAVLRIAPHDHTFPSSLLYFRPPKLNSVAFRSQAALIQVNA